ncbi:hypothetical protein P7C71_g5845, partial [Lecanoromycetidae sp. Uapishka_2]
MSDQKEELNVQHPEETPQEGSTEDTSAAAPAAEAEKKKGSVLSAPGNFGNSAGDKIQGTLGKVGQPVGKGLEYAAAPVGGIVEPLVGGLFKAPQNFGQASEEAIKTDKHNEELE